MRRSPGTSEREWRPSKPALTDSQKRLLAYLARHPGATIADVKAEFGFRSRNAVHWHVRRLESLGLLARPTVRRTGWRVKKS